VSPRLLDALAAAAGAFLGFLIYDSYDRRRAEKRSLTEADQKWMAATHLKGGTDGRVADAA
jgi:hypothetical protein